MIKFLQLLAWEWYQDLELAYLWLVWKYWEVRVMIWKTLNRVASYLGFDGK